MISFWFWEEKSAKLCWDFSLFVQVRYSSSFFFLILFYFLIYLWLSCVSCVNDLFNGFVLVKLKLFLSLRNDEEVGFFVFWLVGYGIFFSFCLFLLDADFDSIQQDHMISYP